MFLWRERVLRDFLFHCFSLFWSENIWNWWIPPNVCVCVNTTEQSDAVPLPAISLLFWKTGFLKFPQKSLLHWQQLFCATDDFRLGLKSDFLSRLHRGSLCETDLRSAQIVCNLTAVCYSKQIIVVDVRSLRGWFSKWGPRTLRGPWDDPRGSLTLRTSLQGSMASLACWLIIWLVTEGIHILFSCGLWSLDEHSVIWWWWDVFQPFYRLVVFCAAASVNNVTAKETVSVSVNTIICSSLSPRPSSLSLWELQAGSTWKHSLSQNDLFSDLFCCDVMYILYSGVSQVTGRALAGMRSFCFWVSRPKHFPTLGLVSKKIKKIKKIQFFTPWDDKQLH